jgi:hypothetical protein
MKCIVLAAFLLAGALAIHAQDTRDGNDKATLEKEFPIILEIDQSFVTPAGVSTAQLAQASAMGMEPPIFGLFKGTLSRFNVPPEHERHWQFGCWAENTRFEQNPCVDMPIGLHRARWVHNRELLEVEAYAKDGSVTLRYLDVTIDPKNPPAPDDPIQNLPTYPGFFGIEQARKNYPLLIHVYGATALNLPAGQLPARINCDITDVFQNRTNINCTQYPPIPLSRGYVVIDASIDGQHGHNISCDAKWKWSKCSVILPGFYAARWKDSGQSQIELLGLRDGKPEEIGFDVR